MAFYDYANKTRKSNGIITSVRDSAGTLTSSVFETVNALNDQYQSVFSIPKEEFKISGMEDDIFQNYYTELDLNVGSDEMLKALTSLKHHTATGPDGVPAVLLKNCKEYVANPLKRILEKSLSSGSFPEALKLSRVKPIFKGGDRSSPRSYRPVSITSQISKLFEKVINAKMVDHVAERGLINPRQYGFVRGKGTIGQLLAHFNNIIFNLQDGHTVDSVYLDFAKAFDKCDHGILIHKLCKIGFGGALGRWIYSFLTRREQYVELDHIQSKVVEVKSGVPQGSVLSALLFIIYINDQ